MEQLLILLDDFKKAHDSFNIEIIYRESEPKYIIKVFETTNSIFVAIYYDTYEVLDMTTEQFTQNIEFAVNQEQQRRWVVKQNVFQTKSD